MSDETTPERQRLEALLQAPAHIADDGFAERVVAALPRRRESRAVYVLVPGAAVVASGLVLAAYGEGITRALVAPLASHGGGVAGALAFSVVALAGALAALSAIVRET